MIYLPKVWVFQPAILHYRTPVFDGLYVGSKDRYEMTVLGALTEGRAYGGEARDYHLDLSRREISLLGQSLEYWPGAYELIRKEKPDVVVSYFNLRNINCWQIPRLCRQNRSASVGWAKVHSLSRIPDFMLQAAKRRLSQQYDLFIVYGKHSATELINLGYPEDRIFIAQNTIDTRRIFDKAEGFGGRAKNLREKYGLSDKKILLYIGKMNPEKRPFDLLDGWPLIKKLAADLVLALVGDGVLLESLRERAKQLDSDRILVIGRVPEGEDYDWIAAADFNIQCGAVGLAINQSMAFGTPTIVADEIGADSELVENKVTGWRYPKGDIEAMIRTLEEIMVDGDSTQNVCSQARALMQHSASIDNMVQVIDECIMRATTLSKKRKAKS